MAKITTYTKKHIDPLNIQPEDFDIKDIAHALSLICRGNGHIKKFYSVAEHCINCALVAKERDYPKDLILACLLHDACECYMSDVPRPFKETLPKYIELEDEMLDKVYLHFIGRKLNCNELELIKQVDDDMLYFDLWYLFDEKPNKPEPKVLLKLDYDDHSFIDVENKYLVLYNELIK